MDKEEFVNERMVTGFPVCMSAIISELEAALENLGADGSLQNGFVSTFGKYLDVKEITSEITAEVLKEVLVYPGNRFEIIWNCREELKNLILDLQ